MPVIKRIVNVGLCICTQPLRVRTLKFFLTARSENGTWAKYFHNIWKNHLVMHARLSYWVKQIKELQVNKAQWGRKLTCHNCGAKFYDLKKKPITCPKCDTPYKEEKVKPRRSMTAEIPKPVKEPVKEPDSEEALIESKLDDNMLDAEDDDNMLDAEDDKVQDVTIMEDTSDIGGDEEDIGEVIGVVDDSGEKE